jgi:hypothetical protein
VCVFECSIGVLPYRFRGLISRRAFVNIQE